MSVQKIIAKLNKSTKTIRVDLETVSKITDTANNFKNDIKRVTSNITEHLENVKSSMFYVDEQLGYLVEYIPVMQEALATAQELGITAATDKQIERLQMAIEMAERYAEYQTFTSTSKMMLKEIINHPLFRQ